MKKIIKNLVYDTETAKECGYYSFGSPRDFSHIRETLFQKRTGEFFLYGVVGPSSKYAQTVGLNEWSGGERIIPLTFEKARDWAEEHLSADEYENIFGEVAEDDSRTFINLSVSKTCADTIRRRAAEKGISQAQYIESLVLNPQP